MAPIAPLQITLLGGAQRLLAVHARELPQRDDLCGAFCGALALRAAGIDSRDGEPIDQDALALAAGTVVSRLSDPGNLPRGEQGRRDYRLAIPHVEDSAVSGTTAGGLASAIEQLSAGELVAVPYSGPWTAATLGALFDLAARLAGPVTFIANLATRHLWGASARPDQMLAYLLDGEDDGPAADWDVGHFVCVVGRASGPHGQLYAVADTYPSLGAAGLHMQPGERLATALARPDMTAGGLIVVAGAQDAATLRAGTAAVGLREEIWDNGTVTEAAPR